MALLLRLDALILLAASRNYRPEYIFLLILIRSSSNEQWINVTATHSNNSVMYLSFSRIGERPETKINDDRKYLSVMCAIRAMQMNFIF